MDAILTGVPLEEQYPYNPYQVHNGICEEPNRVVISENYEEYYDLSEEELLNLLQRGPLAVTVSADNW